MVYGQFKPGTVISLKSTVPSFVNNNKGQLRLARPTKISIERLPNQDWAVCNMYFEEGNPIRITLSVLWISQNQQN